MKYLDKIINIVYGLIVMFALCGFVIGSAELATTMITIIALCWVTSEILARAIWSVLFFAFGAHKETKDSSGKG